MTVIRRVDENWAEGMLGDKIGIFPILYVEVNTGITHADTHTHKLVPLFYTLRKMHKTYKK